MKDMHNTLEDDEPKDPDELDELSKLSILVQDNQYINKNSGARCKMKSKENQCSTSGIMRNELQAGHLPSSFFSEEAKQK